MASANHMKISLVILALGLIARVSAVTSSNDDPNKIESLDYEEFKNSRPPEVARACSTDIMFAYGLMGDATSLGEPNEICPSIQQNCCGQRDQKRIYSLWQKNNKKISTHYKISLLIYRYIIGFGKWYTELAVKISQQFEEQKDLGAEGNSKQSSPSAGNKADGKISFRSDKVCHTAATKVHELGFGERNLAEFYYTLLNQRVQFLQNSRRGFYCMICSVQGQKAIHNTPWIFQWIYNDRIYYNREFCKMLIDHSFRITYELAKTFNHWVRALVTVTTCIDGLPGKGGNDSKNAGASSGAQSPIVKALIKNPLNLGDYFKLEMCDLATDSNFLVFEKCEYWCQEWNIAKPKSLFDSDTRALKRLYNYLQTIEPALRDRNQNMFRDDVLELKSKIDIALKKEVAEPKFFPHISRYQDLSKFKSDFVYSSKGINPMELAKGSPLYFKYEHETIFGVLGLLFAFLSFF